MWDSGGRAVAEDDEEDSAVMMRDDGVRCFILAMLGTAATLLVEVNNIAALLSSRQCIWKDNALNL